MDQREWQTLGADRERPTPSRDFTLTMQALDLLVEDCLELYPPALRCLMGREGQTWSGVEFLEKRNLLSGPFEPYSVRSLEYMVHVSWHPAESSTEDRMTQEKCLYQMMCEETPSGQILFRIYEYLQTPGNPLRMLGGAVVYARSHEGSPDRIRYRYRPHDRKGSYSLPAIRLCRDSMEEVCRKGLSFFLPFRYLQTPGSAGNAEKELEGIRALIRGCFCSENAEARYLEICRQMIAGL